MCEHSSVSSAAALRETRRRKILENSANRLKLIQGINSSLEKPRHEKCPEPTTKPQINVIKYPLTNNESPKQKINSKFNEVLHENKELKDISDFLLRGNNIVEEEEEEETEVAAFEQSTWKTFSETFLEKKLHYILLALLVNAMLFFNVGHLFYENILCPFFTVKLVEVFSKRELEQFQPMLLMLISGLPKKAQHCTKVTLFLFSILISDLCLYLFIFIVGNKISISLG